MKEESNLIIYIIGLILLVTVMCQVRLHLKHKRLEEWVGSAAAAKTEYTTFLLAVSNSQPSSMVNVFGESVGSGSVDLQLVKKVVATVGQYEDYTAEINQSYVLGFPPYRLHTHVDGTFVTPIRVYDEKVYVLDDVATMDVTGRHIVVDKSILIYFVEADDGSGVAQQGDRGPSGVRGLKGDSGD